MCIFNWMGRALLLSVAVVAVGLSGCGGDDGEGENPDNGGVTTSGGGDYSYESVTIGGKIWMKRNLNIQTDNSWCYENSSDSCEKYGRLYTWQAAKSACQLLGGGWHLPTSAEWNALVLAVDYPAGMKLKSTNGWNSYINENDSIVDGNGTDDYSFSALPGGRRVSDGSFGRTGDFGIWWTATDGVVSVAYYRDMNFILLTRDEEYFDNDFGVSVRCIAN
jgi:uncharacterized protein (TIGR02145 family)